MEDQLFGVIYKSTVLIPESSFYNKFVIGKHKCNSIDEFYKSRYVGSSRIISSIKNKYGIDGIKKEVIYCLFNNDTMTTKEKGKILSDFEIHFIKLYESYTNPKIGMNLTPGGDGHVPDNRGKKNGMFGKHHTELSRKKMSLVAMGHHRNIGKFTNEQRIEIRNSNLSVKELAEKFNVWKTTIYKIRGVKR